MRILLAEYNHVNQKVASTLLERQGHKVVIACNGKQAVDLFRRDTFDLVLMDIQMLEMDGVEAASTIRSMEASAGRRTPIFALTAHAMKRRRRTVPGGGNGRPSGKAHSHRGPDARGRIARRAGRLTFHRSVPRLRLR